MKTTRENLDGLNNELKYYNDQLASAPLNEDVSVINIRIDEIRSKITELEREISASLELFSKSYWVSGRYELCAMPESSSEIDFGKLYIEKKPEGISYRVKDSKAELTGHIAWSDLKIKINDEFNIKAVEPHLNAILKILAERGHVTRGIIPDINLAKQEVAEIKKEMHLELNLRYQRNWLYLNMVKLLNQVKKNDEPFEEGEKLKAKYIQSDFTGTKYKRLLLKRSEKCKENIELIGSKLTSMAGIFKENQAFIEQDLPEEKTPVMEALALTEAVKYKLNHNEEISRENFQNTVAKYLAEINKRKKEFQNAIAGIKTYNEIKLDQVLADLRGVYENSLRDIMTIEVWLGKFDEDLTQAVETIKYQISENKYAAQCLAADVIRNPDADVSKKINSLKKSIRDYLDHKKNVSSQPILLPKELTIEEKQQWEQKQISQWEEKDSIPDCQQMINGLTRYLQAVTQKSLGQLAAKKDSQVKSVSLPLVFSKLYQIIGKEPPKVYKILLRDNNEEDDKEQISGMIFSLRKDGDNLKYKFESKAGEIQLAKFPLIIPNPFKTENLTPYWKEKFLKFLIDNKILTENSQFAGELAKEELALKLRNMENQSHLDLARINPSAVKSEKIEEKEILVVVGEGAHGIGLVLMHLKAFASYLEQNLKEEGFHLIWTNLNETIRILNQKIQKSEDDIKALDIVKKKIELAAKEAKKNNAVKIGLSAQNVPHEEKKKLPVKVDKLSDESVEDFKFRDEIKHLFNQMKENFDVDYQLILLIENLKLINPREPLINQIKIFNQAINAWSQESKLPQLLLSKDLLATRHDFVSELVSKIFGKGFPGEFYALKPDWREGFVQHEYYSNLYKKFHTNHQEVRAVLLSEIISKLKSNWTALAQHKDREEKKAIDFKSERRLSCAEAILNERVDIESKMYLPANERLFLEIKGGKGVKGFYELFKAAEVEAGSSKKWFASNLVTMVYKDIDKLLNQLLDKLKLFNENSIPIDKILIDFIGLERELSLQLIKLIKNSPLKLDEFGQDFAKIEELKYLYTTTEDYDYSQEDKRPLYELEVVQNIKEIKNHRNKFHIQIKGEDDKRSLEYSFLGLRGDRDRREGSIAQNHEETNFKIPNADDPGLNFYFPAILAITAKNKKTPEAEWCLCDEKDQLYRVNIIEETNGKNIDELILSVRGVCLAKRNDEVIYKIKTNSQDFTGRITIKALGWNLPRDYSLEDSYAYLPIIFSFINQVHGLKFKIIVTKKKRTSYELAITGKDIKDVDFKGNDSNKIYIKKIAEGIQYSVMSPAKEFVQAVIPSSELKLPDEFVFDKINPYLPLILDIAAASGHTIQRNPIYRKIEELKAVLIKLTNNKRYLDGSFYKNLAKDLKRIEDNTQNEDPLKEYNQIIKEQKEVLYEYIKKILNFYEIYSEKRNERNEDAFLKLSQLYNKLTTHFLPETNYDVNEIMRKIDSTESSISSIEFKEMVLKGSFKESDSLIYVFRLLIERQGHFLDEPSKIKLEINRFLTAVQGVEIYAAEILLDIYQGGGEFGLDSDIYQNIIKECLGKSIAEKHRILRSLISDHCHKLIEIRIKSDHEFEGLLKSLGEIPSNHKSSAWQEALYKFANVKRRLNQLIYKLEQTQTANVENLRIKAHAQTLRSELIKYFPPAKDAKNLEECIDLFYLDVRTKAPNLFPRIEKSLDEKSEVVAIDFKFAEVETVFKTRVLARQSSSPRLIIDDQKKADRNIDDFTKELRSILFVYQEPEPLFALLQQENLKDFFKVWFHENVDGTLFVSQPGEGKPKVDKRQEWNQQIKKYLINTKKSLSNMPLIDFLINCPIHRLYDRKNKKMDRFLQIQFLKPESLLRTLCISLMVQRDPKQRIVNALSKKGFFADLEKILEGISGDDLLIQKVINFYQVDIEIYNKITKMPEHFPPQPGNNNPIIRLIKIDDVGYQPLISVNSLLQMNLVQLKKLLDIPSEREAKYIYNPDLKPLNVNFEEKWAEASPYIIIQDLKCLAKSGLAKNFIIAWIFGLNEKQRQDLEIEIHDYIANENEISPKIKIVLHRIMASTLIKLKLPSEKICCQLNFVGEDDSKCAAVSLALKTISIKHSSCSKEALEEPYFNPDEFDRPFDPISKFFKTRIYVYDIDYNLNTNKTSNEQIINEAKEFFTVLLHETIKTYSADGNFSSQALSEEKIRREAKDMMSQMPDKWRDKVLSNKFKEVSRMESYTKSIFLQENSSGTYDPLIPIDLFLEANECDILNWLDPEHPIVVDKKLESHLSRNGASDIKSSLPLKKLRKKQPVSIEPGEHKILPDSQFSGQSSQENSPGKPANDPQQKASVISLPAAEPVFGSAPESVPKNLWQRLMGKSASSPKPDEGSEPKAPVISSPAAELVSGSAPVIPSPAAVPVSGPAPESRGKGNFWGLFKSDSSLKSAEAPQQKEPVSLLVGLQSPSEEYENAAVAPADISPEEIKDSSGKSWAVAVPASVSATPVAKENQSRLFVYRSPKMSAAVPSLGSASADSSVIRPADSDTQAELIKSLEEESINGFLKPWFAKQWDNLIYQDAKIVPIRSLLIKKIDDFLRDSKKNQPEKELVRMLINCPIRRLTYDYALSCSSGSLQVNLPLSSENKPLECLQKTLWISLAAIQPPEQKKWLELEDKNNIYQIVEKQIKSGVKTIDVLENIAHIYKVNIVIYKSKGEGLNPRPNKALSHIFPKGATIFLIKKEKELYLPLVQLKHLEAMPNEFLLTLFATPAQSSVLIDRGSPLHSAKASEGEAPALRNGFGQ